MQYPATLPSHPAAGLFLALDGTSMRIDPSTSGRKYHKSVNNAAFIRNESSICCFSSGYECIPIKAHTTVATQHMPCGLSNTDYRIWENISVGNAVGVYTR